MSSGIELSIPSRMLQKQQPNEITTVESELSIPSRMLQKLNYLDSQRFDVYLSIPSRMLLFEGVTAPECAVSISFNSF